MSNTTRIPPTPPRGTPKPRYVAMYFDAVADYSEEIMTESRAAAVRLANAWNSQRAKSAAAFAILSNGRRVRIGGAR